MDAAVIVGVGVCAGEAVVGITWLAAQENLNCSAAANVSMYSIQPGSAYSPANYQGTMFTTDPTYTLTDGTLTNYMNLVTC